MIEEGHPVIVALRDVQGIERADLAAFRRLARSYEGRRLPAHIERRPLGTCYVTADELEAEGHGRRVRGFAIEPLTSTPTPHAWNSLNGRDARDAVWATFSDTSSYAGIESREHEDMLDRMTEACGRKAFAWAWRGLY